MDRLKIASPFLARKMQDEKFAEEVMRGFQEENSREWMRRKILEDEEIAKKSRRVKYEVLACSTLRFLEGKIDVEGFLEELTAICELFLDALCPPELCIVAFGKLGARELNFSSDIDIVPIFSHHLDTEESATSKARQFVRLLSAVTLEGFLWRVDLDLRPAGKEGPMCPSEEFFTWYYLNFGGTDERYYLLRARPVAGMKEIGERTLKNLENFVFRKYLDFSVLERLRDIKLRISSSAKRKPYDVKFSEGGIRDAEFVVFAHQLILGGRFPEVRGARTTEVMDTLKSHVEFDVEAFKSAYLFLRFLECMIQMEEEEQRFHMGSDDIKRICETFGYTESKLLKEFSEKCKFIKEVFDSVLKPVKVLKAPDIADLSQSELEMYLKSLGFKNPRSMSGVLKGISGRSDVISKFIIEASKSPDLDMSVANFTRFMERIGGRRYWSTLSESEGLLRTLAKLFGTSSLFSNFIVAHPELLDVIILPRVDRDPEEELWEALVKADDFEEALDILRKFAKEKTMQILLDDLAGALDSETTSRALTRLTDAIIRCSAKFIKDDERFSIVTLGKYGSCEILYGSDVDLIFVYDDNPLSSGVWAKVAQKILLLLNVPTKEGIAVKVDMRLRPSGRFGPVVVSSKALGEYYKKADFWERFAFLKARTVVGNINVWEVKEKAFLEVRMDRLRENLRSARDKMVAKLGTKAGKLNLKYCKGGFLDVDLIVGYLKVKHRLFTHETVFFDETKLEECYRRLRDIEKEMKIKSDVYLEDLWIAPDKELRKTLSEVERIFLKYFG